MPNPEALSPTLADDAAQRLLQLIGQLVAESHARRTVPVTLDSSFERDLGIAFDDCNLEGMQTVPLLEERLYLVVAPGSPLARRKLVSLKELAALDFVRDGRLDPRLAITDVVDFQDAPARLRDPAMKSVFRRD